jgi:hypothetical protein
MQKSAPAQARRPAIVPSRYLLFLNVFVLRPEGSNRRIVRTNTSLVASRWPPPPKPVFDVAGFRSVSFQTVK